MYTLQFKILGLGRVFLKKNYAFFQQGHIKWIKSDSEDIYHVTNISNKCCSLKLYILIKESLTNISKNVFPQTYSAAQLFSTFDINNNMFPEHQIDLLEWYLKNHVTLKTGIMTAENSALPSQE